MADHVADRRTRWLIAGTCLVLDGLVQVGDLRLTAVRPLDTSPDEHAHTPNSPRALQTGAALLRAGLEWTVVAGLRRTRLRQPNTAAGLVLAAGTLLAAHVQALQEIASIADGPPDTQGSTGSSTGTDVLPGPGTPAGVEAPLSGIRGEG